MIIINSRFLTQTITGVQRYAIEIAKELIKYFSEIEFIAPKNICQLRLADHLRVKSFGNLSGSAWEQIELPLYLKRNGSPLIVNLANTAPLLYNKQIVVIHDLSFLRNSSWFSKKFYLYYKFLIPRIAQKSIKIITVSEFSKKEIIDLLKIPEKKIAVAYNSVSEVFSNISSHTSTVAVNDYGDYILFVGSLEPRKNLKNLILAFDKLKLKDVKLVIAGAENKNIFHYEDLDKSVQPDHNVVFIGHASDDKLVKLYSNAKIFIFPSLYEGFGIPPLEAMACGCPVVVSNVSSMPEVCGDAAYYVDPYNVESIAEGINTILTDDNLRRSLIKKGYERVKLFSWGKSASKHLEVIEEILYSA